MLCAIGELPLSLYPEQSTTVKDAPLGLKHCIRLPIII
jgi:hypothetical protein